MPMKVTYKSKTDKLQIHSDKIGDPRVQPKTTETTAKEHMITKYDMKKKKKGK